MNGKALYQNEYHLHERFFENQYLLSPAWRSKPAGIMPKGCYNFQRQQTKKYERGHILGAVERGQNLAGALRKYRDVLA